MQNKFRSAKMRSSFELKPSIASSYAMLGNQQFKLKRMTEKTFVLKDKK
jgi:hypothetical protein